MKKIILIFVLLIMVGCKQQIDQTEKIEPQIQGNTNNEQLANPASVYCEDNGGSLEIRTAADGSQTGFCTLPDGTVCEEWAMDTKKLEWKRQVSRTGFFHHF